MFSLKLIINKVKSYYPQADFSLIKKAYIYGLNAHIGQFRKSGKPFFSHPLAVAKILSELKLDTITVCTGLLHDTVEDTNVEISDINQRFGFHIANLVEGVTKLSKIKCKNNEERQAENFRKMLIAMSKDIRVLLIKLADRLHNMRTIQYMSYDKQKTISLETMQIYVPLANRLGIGWLKTELEDIGFKFFKKKEYSNLKKKSIRLEERENFLLKKFLLN